MRPVVDPRLFTSMPQFFPSLCSVYDVAEVTNAIGERIPTPEDAYLSRTLGARWESIPCAIGDSKSLRRNQIAEQRTEDSTYASTMLVVMLGGNYPLITEKMRAVVDGTVYDILGTSQSPVTSHTELIVEAITF